MKFVFLFLVLTSQVFGAVSPQEKREALGTTESVMTKLTSTEAKLITASVVDEIGTRLIVEFAYKEDMSGIRKCTYAFDRVLKRPLTDSGVCDL